MRYFLSFLMVIFTVSHAWGYTKECDHNVNFNNTNTYKGLTGDISCFDDDGKKERTTTLVNGEIMKDIYYSPTGVVTLVENYQNGKINGVVERYYPSGKLEQLQNYKDDQTAGVQKRFHEDGTTLAHLDFEDPNDSEVNSNVDLNMQGNPTNVVCGKKYPPSFQKYCSAPVQIYSEDNQKGPMFVPEGTSYSGTISNQNGIGAVSSEASYKNGIKNGEEKVFNDSGKLIATKNYFNGEISGKQTTYYPDTGTVNEVKVIDAETGRSTKTEAFYQNGNPKYSKEYLSKTSYITKSYYDNGKPSEEATYTADDECSEYCNDKITGDSKEWDNNALLTVISHDDKGKVSKEVYYDGSGNIVNTKYYYPDGSEKITPK